MMRRFRMSGSCGKSSALGMHGAGALSGPRSSFESQFLVAAASGRCSALRTLAALRPGVDCFSSTPELRLYGACLTTRRPCMEG